MVPTSSALLADVNAYFDSLGAYREGDVDSYLTVVARATPRAAHEATKLGADLRDVSNEWRDTMKVREGKATATAPARLLEGLLRQPLISAAKNAISDADAATVYRAIDRLVASEILTEMFAEVADRWRVEKWLHGGDPCDGACSLQVRYYGGPVALDIRVRSGAQVHVGGFRHCAGGLQLNDKPVVHEKVRVVFPKDFSVFVMHHEWVLLFDVKTQLSQAVGQSILIHFFEMPVPVTEMDVVGGLPNCVT